MLTKEQTNKLRKHIATKLGNKHIPTVATLNKWASSASADADCYARAKTCADGHIAYWLKHGEQANRKTSKGDKPGYGLSKLLGDAKLIAIPPIAMRAFKLNKTCTGVVTHFVNVPDKRLPDIYHLAKLADTGKYVLYNCQSKKIIGEADCISKALRLIAEQ